MFSLGICVAISCSTFRASNGFIFGIFNSTVIIEQGIFECHSSVITATVCVDSLVVSDDGVHHYNITIIRQNTGTTHIEEYSVVISYDGCTVFYYYVSEFTFAHINVTAAIDIYEAVSYGETIIYSVMHWI